LRAEGSGLACRQFTGAIEHDWRVASFTSFAAGSHGPELPDRDPLSREEAALTVEPLRDEPAPLSIFDFPRGSRAGTVLHEIFERIDFASPDRPALERLVAQVLTRSGFDASWQGPVARMVENVLATRLDEGEGGFALQELAGGSWRAELEFFFPLRFISSERLQEIVLRWQGPAGEAGLGEAIGRLAFTPVRGMVRGFMDLVFCHHGRYYIADWKSNHLGDRLEDYGGERLAGEMERRLYPLQYLLYTVALHNYLTARLPGYDYASHFGGVYYLFLRGIDPAAGPSHGIFRDRPQQGLIEELSAALVDYADETTSRQQAKF
jgi:exodeoxyribonuclease V beta subunit